MTKISQQDVLELLKDPSADKRAGAAEKVAFSYESDELTDKEREIAEEIFNALVKDVEIRVRRALADSLKSADIPRELALKLANDVAEVAVPFIEVSDVLTDEDLVQIVAGNSEDHQVAVARRDNISEQVADALVNTDNQEVVRTLVNNETAKISEPAMNRVLDKFGDVKEVSTPLASRSNLPLDIAERLVTLVSDKIKTQLLTQQEISADLASDLILQTREKATVSLLDGSAEAPDVHALVEQLHKSDRLTPTIIVRALCMGDLTFFESALAKRAGIPVSNVYKLVYEHGENGLARLFDRASMPDSMLKLSQVAIELAEDMSLNSRDDRDRYREVMIERVLTHFEDDFDNDNLDYFISKLGRKEGGDTQQASA